jgi:formylglycine-generating enzyme required for sulfatase activity
MTRNTNYGTLRGGGNRRGGGGAWQWVVIGFVGGFGCAAIIGLVAIIGGLDPGGLLTANRPTSTPFVITNTPLPATNTLEPTEVLIIPTSTPNVEQPLISAPTATPTTDPATLQVQPSATPTTQAPPTQNANISSAGTGGGAEVPQLLQGILTQMQQVTGGTFQMGTTPQEVQAAVNECVDVYDASCDITMGEDSAPVHNVTIDPFMMEVTEVTYVQYMAFLNSKGPRSHLNGCNGQPCIKTRAEDPNSNVIFDSANYRVVDVIQDFPVTAVTWYGAQAYCEAIGRRLPTEAEWERAARGPENFLYPWGNTFNTDLAKTSRPRPDDPTLAGATAVSSYGVGAWALYDMAGNVAEWVNDWYSPSYYLQLQQSGDALNPQGPPAGTEKSVRGGSWDTPPFFARGVHRQSFAPVDGALWIGFRCAADLGAENSGTTGNTGTTGTTDTSGTTVDTPVNTPSGAANEEDTNAQPLLPSPAIPTTQSNQPLPTLNPGG